MLLTVTFGKVIFSATCVPVQKVLLLIFIVFKLLLTITAFAAEEDMTFKANNWKNSSKKGFSSDGAGTVNDRDSSTAQHHVPAFSLIPVDSAVNWIRNVSRIDLSFIRMSVNDMRLSYTK